MCLHCEVSSDAPPPLGVRPFSSGYAQNRHETLRMLRNHHANPPTHIPVTARMCMPGPGLVVRGGHEGAPGTSGTDDAELQSSKWLRCGGSARYGYREMKRCRSARHGNNEAWEPGRVAAQPGGRPLASESARIGTAETTRALEEERPSVETHGEKYGSHR